VTERPTVDGVESGDFGQPKHGRNEWLKLKLHREGDGKVKDNRFEQRDGRMKWDRRIGQK
jgi:hypothetical protein